MTEAEWLTCADPVRMLEFLRGKASDRKLRLYLCGGCRQIAWLFFDPVSHAAIDVAEKFADGEADCKELGRAEWEAECPTFGYDFDPHYSFIGYVKANLPRLVVLGAIDGSALSDRKWRVNEGVKKKLIAAASIAEYCASPSPLEFEWGVDYIAEVEWPGRWLFDCIFANPFHNPKQVKSSWLNWNDATVVKLAQSIYTDRAFDRLPILADALEDAGCDDADILTHCRSTGPHVRGCWVIDLLLGKE